MTVTAAKVKALQVTPPTASTPVGLEKPFVATAILTDGTPEVVTNHSAVTWTSSDTNIATVVTGQANGNGVATGRATGEVTITASGTVNSTPFEGSATLRVTSAVPVAGSMQVSPITPSIAKGAEQEFEASYGLSDGNREDVTNDKATSWVSTNTSVATITSLKPSTTVGRRAWT